MDKRYLLAIVFGIALIGFSSSQQVYALTFTILNNPTGGDCASIGSWDLSTLTCTLTADLNLGDNLVIGSSGITLDGDNNSLTGAGTGNGILVQAVNGVTIKNINIASFSRGINLYAANGHTITGNTVSGNFFGILLDNSVNNLIDDNTVTGSRNGIYLIGGSTDNIISNNDASNNVFPGESTTLGIVIGADRNTVTNNIANSNDDVGIFLSPCSDCTVTGNTVNSNDVGIGIRAGSSGTTIDGNTVSSNGRGIDVQQSSNNIISNNNLANNAAAGILVYTTSNGNTISDNTATSNAHGIRIDTGSSNNLISDNTATSNILGIVFTTGANGNTVTDNTLDSNNNGVFISNSNSNQVFNNNFINNAIQAEVLGTSSGNVFHQSLAVGGNYWSNFDQSAEGCIDASIDGICDASFVFAGGQDNLPWTALNLWQNPPDNDGDAIPNFFDSCPNDANNDVDADGVCGDVDNCPATPNPGQEDADSDGIGDVCDAPTEATLDADKDSFLRKGAKNTNEGDNTILMVQKAGNKRTLISFDLSEYEGQEATSATLRLYVTYNGGNWGKHNDKMIEIHKLLEDWTQGNGANFIPKNLDEDDEPVKNRGTGPGVTWNCATDTNISNKKVDCDPKWNGGNFDGAITDSEVITSTTSGWIEFDVTGDVNSIIAQREDNFGWLIKKSNEGNSGRIAFASSEHADISIHPQLILSGLHPQTTPPPGL